MDWVVLLAVLAVGWVMNEREKALNRRFDRIDEQLNGLRVYLYEIDPQFDDERNMAQAMDEGDAFDAGAHHHFMQQQQAEGKRTLNTTFFDPDT